MSIVTVEKTSYKVDPLYQWDINQTLKIYGLSLASIPEIHFTNDSMDRAIVRQATMDAAGVITADVPNSLLQKPSKIKAYVCIYEGKTFKSLYMVEIPVKARNKPSDYTLTDDPEVYSFNALENQVVNALARMETLNTQSNNALTEALNTYNASKTAYDNAKTAYENAKDEVDAAVEEAAKTAVEAMTPDDIGAAAEEHTHSADDITAGILAVARGGTGVASLEELYTALGASTIVTGTYTGNGKASRTISLGFTPKAVLVAANSNLADEDYIGFAVTDSPSYGSSATYTAQIVTGGFSVSWNATSGTVACTNTKNNIYHYIAIA